MILNLDDSLLTQWDALIGQQIFHDAMRNLALAFYEGKHVVTGPRKLLAKLGRNETLDATTQGRFREIEQRYQDAQKLVGQVSHYIQVCADLPANRSPAQPHKHGDALVWSIPYTHVADSSRIQATVLLAENADDAELYERVARAYVLRSQIGKRLHVCCEPLGGGGSTTAEQLRSHSRTRPTLCIVDSDQTHPGAALGSTAKAVQDTVGELQRGAKPVIAHGCVLPCRELDNLIPGNLLLDSLPKNSPQEHRERCRQAEVLGILGTTSDGKYLDLKKGLALWDVFAAKHPHERTFLAKQAEDCKPRVAGRAGSWCEDACDSAERAHCRCIVFEGLGHNLVSYAAMWAQEHSPKALADYLFSVVCSCKETWQELGHLLATWT